MAHEDLNSKFKEAIVLENRKKIYELVRSSPGCHFREIERKIVLPHGTLRYNLNFLVKKELLVEKKDGNNTRYFSKDFSSYNYELLGLLRQKSIRKIILFIVSQKKCFHKDITAFVNLSPSTISWHLNKLVEKGIVEKIWFKNHSSYKVKINENEIIKLLISYKDSFLDSLVNKTIEMWDLR